MNITEILIYTGLNVKPLVNIFDKKILNWQEKKYENFC